MRCLTLQLYLRGLCGAVRNSGFFLCTIQLLLLYKQLIHIFIILQLPFSVELGDNSTRFPQVKQHLPLMLICRLPLYQSPKHSLWASSLLPPTKMVSSCRDFSCKLFLGDSPVDKVIYGLCWPKSWTPPCVTCCMLEGGCFMAQEMQCFFA